MGRIGYTILATAGLMATGTAWAAGPAAVRKQVEASMVVTGKIQVDPTGNVSGYTLDEPDKLPPAVVDVLGRRVPEWRFKPVLVQGQPAHVRADMSVRLVAKKVDKDNYIVSIRGTAFGDESDKSRAERVQEALKAKRDREAVDGICKNGLTPPNYPPGPARSGVAANVYLLLRAGPDGRVQDVIAEQVNLKAVANERTMEHLRRTFAGAAMRQARKWCIEPPRENLQAQAGYRVLRVPVAFLLDAPVYGRWEAYVPGPRQANPWPEIEEGKGFSPDTLAPGHSYVAGSGLKLLVDPSGT